MINSSNTKGIVEMKKICLGLMLFSTLVIGGNTVFADSISETNESDAIEITAENVEISENIADSPILSRAAQSIKFSEWLNVGGKSQNGRWVPVSTRIWQVRYVGGTKYQGYVNWTGATKVNVSDPRPNLNKYLFQGTLKRA